MDGSGIVMLLFGSSTFILGVLVTVLYHDLRRHFK